MEIRIKTADEFRDQHVTIEIRATPDETYTVSQKMFDDFQDTSEVTARRGGIQFPGHPVDASVDEDHVAEVADLQAHITRLVGQIKVLEKGAQDWHELWVTERDARRKAEHQRNEYDRDRHTEQARADRAVKVLIPDLQLRLEESESQRKALERQVDNLTARPAAEVERELRARIIAPETDSFRDSETIKDLERYRSLSDQKVKTSKKKLDEIRETIKVSMVIPTEVIRQILDGETTPAE